MNRTLLTVSLLSLFLLVNCSSGQMLGAFTGGGPNVAANTQAGKTNNQTIGSNTTNELKLVRPQARTIEQSTGPTRVRSERVETIRVQEKDAPWLIWSFAIALALAAAGWIHGWLTPSPRQRKLERENAKLLNS